MDPQEIRDKIMAAINGIIKDEPETASTNLHDVLAAKMRDRMNPTAAAEADAEEEPEVDLDVEEPPVEPAADEPPTNEEVVPPTEEA